MGVSEYFAQDYLPIMLASLCFEQEGIRIIPQLGRSTELRRRLNDGQLDMLIAVDALETLHSNVQKASGCLTDAFPGRCPRVFA
ncbi:hypothetical protein HORIV_27660 [Vreelandella olivaria]|uniref:Uncharacterized protein n=1 Tax=Vreelandella olivaria TaxID=390919 RepID=A0ABM7GID0_9GAMM|nr:hypothetical protein HORIV_27660 [Halomonas olivaria]